MIFFLYGTDTFRSRQKLKELKEKFIREVDKTGINLTVLGGEKLIFNQFREALQISSFFARKRMVVVDNLISKNKSKKIQQEIVNYLDSKESSKDEILIFIEDKGAKSRQNQNKGLSGVLFARLLKEKYIQEFESLHESQLGKWIKNEVNKRGGKIEIQALNILASYVGQDLWQMSNEIDKLLAYAPEITSESVNLLVRSKLDENIFNLMDAISAKDKRSALKLIQEQLKGGANEIYLLTMLVRQFRILLEAKDFLERVKNFYPSSQEIAKELGLHPYVAKKALGQARNFTLSELKNIYQKLLQIDVKIKTGQGRPRMLFDMFIISL